MTKTEEQHRAAFIKFHDENRHILRLYVRFADELLAAGREKASIALLTERIRWETLVQTVGDQFKINNNFRAHYARILNAMPRFAGMFATRETGRPA